MLNNSKQSSAAQSRFSFGSKFLTAILSALTIFTALVPPPAMAQSLTTDIKIVNRSSFAIYAIYLSPNYAEKWGADKLGDTAILHPDHYITLRHVGLGSYDLKLVDEDDDTCVVSNVSIDYSTTEWVITNTWLLGCEFHN